MKIKLETHQLGQHQARETVDHGADRQRGAEKEEVRRGKGHDSGNKAIEELPLDCLRFCIRSSSIVGSGGKSVMNATKEGDIQTKQAEAGASGVGEGIRIDKRGIGGHRCHCAEKACRSDQRKTHDGC